MKLRCPSGVIGKIFDHILDSFIKSSGKPAAAMYQLAVLIHFKAIALTAQICAVAVDQLKVEYPNIRPQLIKPYQTWI